MKHKLHIVPFTEIENPRKEENNIWTLDALTKKIE